MGAHIHKVYTDDGLKSEQKSNSNNSIEKEETSKSDLINNPK